MKGNFVPSVGFVVKAAIATAAVFFVWNAFYAKGDESKKLQNLGTPKAK